MNKIRIILSLAAMRAISACGLASDGGYGRVETDKTVDYGQGKKQKDLSQLVAGIWVDPNGCDHWIIDDGIEGYLSQRLNPKTGKPVCSGIAPPNTATGPYKGNETVTDPL